MVADVLVSRELKSLQEELVTSQKERAATPASASAGGGSSAQPQAEPPSETELQDQLRHFANELTDLFDEAEKNISAHPTQSVVGALLVGILIGRLLGRR
jgi:ElaB/YqjD/DUF883 family membrane-anchored ribosome-binding protein